MITIRHATHRFSRLLTAGLVATLPMMAIAETTAEALLSAHNQLRSEAGKPALCSNEQLQNAAEQYCETMASTGRLSHIGPDGSNPGTRMRAAGYAYSAWGENAALGQRDVPAVMQAWKNSSGHYANIVNGVYKEAGFAKCGSQYQPYWVAMFAAPLSGKTNCIAGSSTTTDSTTNSSAPPPSTTTQDPGLIIYNSCKAYTDGWHLDRNSGLYYIQYNDRCYKYNPSNATMYILLKNAEGYYRFYRL